MVIIKLSFNKLERNKKMSLQFIESENNEFIEDEEIKGKYCKEKLNKILEYEKKNFEIFTFEKKFKSNCRRHYSTNIFNGNYNIDFSPFLIDLKCKIYKRKNDDLTLDKIIILQK